MKKSTEIIIYILFLFAGIQLVLLLQFAYPYQYIWISRHSTAEIQGRYGEFDYIEIQDDSDTKIGYYVVIPEYHGILGDQPAVVYAITYWDHSPNDWIESHGWRRCYLPD